MSDLFDSVNQILTEWNPLEVGGDVVGTEYMDYIPDIIQRSKNQEDLMTYLIDLVSRVMGLEYNEDKHNPELRGVSIKISNLLS